MSFCENYQIFVYDGYFIIYRTEETGQLSYFRSVQETVPYLLSSDPRRNVLVKVLFFLHQDFHLLPADHSEGHFADKDSRQRLQD